VAILNNDRPVISGFENAGLIVHIMDSVGQGHYHCIYCTTELIRSRGNTGTGVPSPEPWYYMHPRNGPNDCGNTANYRVFSVITGSLRMTEPGRGLKIREENPWFGRALSCNSDTHQLVGRNNRPGHRLSKPRGGPRPRSSSRSSRVRDHLTGEVERFALSRRPRAAGWARQAAQLFRLKRHGDVC
jgi:hypothetical protein